MINRIKILTIGAAVLFMISCSDFLDRQPLDQITSGNFYNTAEEANLAAIGMYSAIQGINWYGKSWMITEIPSDNSTTGGNDPDFSPIDNFTVNADNPPLGEFWQEHYRLITLANQVLDNVPAIDMDETQKSALLGEARFLRAFSYFDLVRIFGDVPIVTTVPDISSDLNVSRSSVADVYDLIMDDLAFARTSLPSTRGSSELGRATSDAAAALLAKVYLTTGNYDGAMEASLEVINSGRYRLMDDFAQNWLRDVSDNNAESIFQLQYIGCGPSNTGNALQGFFAPWGQAITKNTDGWGSQIPTSPSIDQPGTTIRDAYTEDDLRVYHTIMTPGTHYPMLNPEEGGYTYPAVGASRATVNIKKYVIGGGADVCFLSTPQNIHIIRYADVLLSFVEASTRRNGDISVTPAVLEAFNAVRTRAGLEPVLSVTTKDVFDERRKEFAFENHRWFDLLRQGNVKETMLLHGKSMQDYHVLFPLPSEELAINPNLTQNPGY